MGFFQRLFGKQSTEHQSTQSPANGEQQNSLSKLIKEASDIAEKDINLQQSGSVWLASTNTKVGDRLLKVINEALELSPNNPDLLVAKYAALTLSFQAGYAKEALTQALDIDPNHFDGIMLRDYPESWQHLFHFPPWSENHKILHSVMSSWLNMGQSTQIIRDGMSIGIAVVNAVNSDNLPSAIRRSAWKLIWSKTPYGNIAFHYSLIDCGSDKTFKLEAGIPHIAELLSPTARSGYWILRRLTHLEHCYVVFADGNKVLHNSKYVFPKNLKVSFEKMDSDLKTIGPISSASSCQAAANWYMQNVNFESITF